MGEQLSFGFHVSWRAEFPGQVPPGLHQLNSTRCPRIFRWSARAWFLGQSAYLHKIAVRGFEPPKPTDYPRLREYLAACCDAQGGWSR